MIYPKQLIKKALKESGKLLLTRFGEFFKGEVKENQSSIVTEMDLASESLISRILTSKYPGHSFIGEEKGIVLTGSEYTWIIDPLDGTSNYAAGIPWFGVLIALFHHHHPIAAGAYLPVFNQLYYAGKNSGAYCNEEPIFVTGETNLKNLLFAYAMDYAVNLEKTRMETDLLFRLISKVRNIRATNCLVDFCYVADGRLGGNINHSCKIWDIAALQLIIEEAGGFMSQLNGEEINFDLSPGGMLKDYRVVTGSKLLKEQIIGIINQK